MKVYEGTWEELEQLGYTSNFDKTYYFKHLNGKYSAIFIDVATRLISTESIIDIAACEEELSKLKIRG